MNQIDIIVNFVATLVGLSLALTLFLVFICWLFICPHYDKMFKYKFKLFESWLFWGNPFARSMAYTGRIVFQKIGKNGLFNRYLFEGYDLRKDATLFQQVLSYIFLGSIFMMLGLAAVLGIFLALQKLLPLL